MTITANVTTLGIAKETVVGTAVAPTAFIPITSPKWTPQVSTYDDEGFRGSAVKSYNTVVGSSYNQFEFDFPVFFDAIGWVLAGLLNDVATTGAADPYMTTFAVLNSGTQQPTTYTLTDYNGNNSRAHAGTVFDKLDLNFTADSLLTATAHGTGMTFATTTNATSSYSTYVVQPNYKCTVTIGGVTNPKVLDGTMTIQRTSDPILTLGNQNPTDIFAAGDLDVSGKLTLVYDANADTLLGDALAATASSLTLDWIQTAVNRELKLQMSDVIFKAPTLDRAAGSFVKLPVDFSAKANTTDVGASAGYSPIKATLYNDRPSGTYK